MQPRPWEEVIHAAELPARLRHVYWIGGGSGAGKSTTARRLAERYGWHLYMTDDVMADHAARTTREDAPLLHRFLAMSMDDRWVNRSPKDMFETFHWFRGEGFGLIVEDLLRLPREPCVLVEGFRLLPHLVKPLLAVPEQAVWLLPTPEFRQSAFLGRSAPGEGFVWRTSDPARAGRNLAERDRMFTGSLREETERLRLRAVQVDTTMTEEDLAEQVIRAFRL
ncbi:hypothetical protein AQJ66_23830 [Streptomyces bungoensis]|uniref:Cytidylate kinase n=1 Tax=Streptomyces bungoensis TaxID=285568 RepID=A0A101SWS0_9ACTN|nr:hypothetical protein [Streptomyces bungoensis]KUN81597.1 hypothetical protein AQJ66_23830 [Streptomyces bungoensis]